RVVHVQSVPLREQQDRGGGELLGDRTGVEDGARGDRDRVGHVGETAHAGPHDVALLAEGHRATRRVGGQGVQDGLRTGGDVGGDPRLGAVRVDPVHEIVGGVGGPDVAV